jgi:rod shape-determining protein MreD
MFSLLTGVAMVQTTILSSFNILGGQPNLMLLVVLMWTVVRGMQEGLVWAFVGGLILDLLSGGPLAGMALAQVAAAFLAGQSLGQEVGSQAVRVVILTVLGAIVYHLAVLIILNWSGYSVDWRFSLLRVAAPSVVLNALLAPLILPLLIWLERATGEEGLVL